MKNVILVLLNYSQVSRAARGAFTRSDWATFHHPDHARGGWTIALHFIQLLRKTKSGLHACWAFHSRGERVDSRDRIGVEDSFLQDSQQEFILTFPHQLQKRRPVQKSRALGVFGPLDGISQQMGGDRLVVNPGVLIAAAPFLLNRAIFF